MNLRKLTDWYVYSVALLTVLCAACSTAPKLKYSPDTLGWMYERGMEESKATLKAVDGKDHALNHDVNIQLVKAEGKSASGAWVFRWQGKDNMWVGGGNVGGTLIYLPCNPATYPNPATMDDVFYPAYLHECAHSYLIQEQGDFSHNPLYAGKFYNWADTAPTVGAKISSSGEQVVIDREFRIVVP